MITPISNYIVGMSDIDAVKKDNPFMVKIISDKAVDVVRGEYLVFLKDWIIITKYRQGPTINFGPTITVFGFKHEQDATAFKLKFGGI